MHCNIRILAAICARKLPVCFTTVGLDIKVFNAWRAMRATLTSSKIFSSVLANTCVSVHCMICTYCQKQWYKPMLAFHLPIVLRSFHVEWEQRIFLHDSDMQQLDYEYSDRSITRSPQWHVHKLIAPEQQEENPSKQDRSISMHPDWPPINDSHLYHHHIIDICNTHHTWFSGNLCNCLAAVNLNWYVKNCTRFVFVSVKLTLHMPLHSIQYCLCCS